MEFFIRQGSTDPILKLKLIDDGKHDKSSFNELLNNSEITFEMFDVKKEEYVVLNGQCLLTFKTKKFANTNDEYFITYRFSEDQTSKKGRYEGLVTIQFLDVNQSPTTKLILPIQEKLFINVI
jgi:hypothetical protein